MDFKRTEYFAGGLYIAMERLCKKKRTTTSEAGSVDTLVKFLKPKRIKSEPVWLPEYLIIHSNNLYRRN